MPEDDAFARLCEYMRLEDEAFVEAARKIRHMYMALIGNGFTAEQALYLTAVYVQKNF